MVVHPPARPDTEPASGLVGSRGRHRILLLAGGVVLVLALAGSVGAALLRGTTSVQQSDLLPPQARSEPGAAVQGPLNFLLIGSDLRVATPGEGQRADTIIIAHVTRSMDRAFLVSIPRDLLVDIPPAYELDFGGDTTKINAALEYGGGGVGGTRLLSLTLNELIGIRFDGAAVVDFDGLRRAVDVLGGVEMCVDVRVASIHTARIFEPGCQQMDGQEALDYLRQRAFHDGDFSRQRHQQEFVRAFLDRARTTGVLTNPFRLAALVQAVAAATTLDTGGVQVPDLLFALRDLAAADLTGVRVPHYLDVIGGVSYVIATEDANGLYDAVREDTLEAWTAGHPEWVS